jgi:hypothetical protein
MGNRKVPIDAQQIALPLRKSVARWALVSGHRASSAAYEGFVVVAMGLKRDGTLRANFVTCYQADNSMGKMRSSLTSSRAACPSC